MRLLPERRHRDFHPNEAKPIPFKKTGIVLVVLIIVIVTLRIAMAPVLLRFVNKKLNEIPDYRGEVGGIEMSLWRGAYQIKDIKLEKMNGRTPVPFYASDLVDLSVEWKSLIHGSLVGEIEITHPQVNFAVAANAQGGNQTSIDTSWTTRVEELFPFKINRFRIHAGEIHFRDFQRDPKVDIHMDHIEAEATNLTNARNSGGTLPSEFHCTGTAMKQAAFKLEMKLDPFAKNPTFDMNAELHNLELTQLNDFFKAYADLDVKRGTFDLVSEVASADGHFKGYVKPLAKDIQFADLKKDAKKGPVKLLWEFMAQGLKDVLENKPERQVATQIPFSGSFQNPRPAVIAAAGYLLRNGFIRALKPSLANTIEFKSVSKGRPVPEKKSK